MGHSIRVSAIQRLCLHDGPGVRTTLFLKGCYLSCPWCCNPETIHYEGDTYFIKDRSLCGSSKICSSCEERGGSRLKGHCPLGAFERTYRDYTPEELCALLLRDRSLFESGGGVTLSGGEPLMQAPQLLPLLDRLKSERIHIALETSLYAPKNHFELIKSFVDYWIVDVKFQFGFISYLEKDLFLEDFGMNLEWVQANALSRMKTRMVISHQAIPYLSSIVERLKRYHVCQVELLPCHQLAENKYRQLGMRKNCYYAPTEKELEHCLKVLCRNDISVEVLPL